MGGGPSTVVGAAITMDGDNDQKLTTLTEGPPERTLHCSPRAKHSACLNAYLVFQPFQSHEQGTPGSYSWCLS